MVSIRQNANRDVLPDFRNLGVIARILIGVNLALFAGTLFAMPQFMQAMDRFVLAAAFIEPLLLALIIVLFLFARLLRRLPYWAGCIAVLAIVVAVVAVYVSAFAAISPLPCTTPPEKNCGVIRDAFIETKRSRTCASC